MTRDYYNDPDNAFAGMVEEIQAKEAASWRPIDEGIAEGLLHQEVERECDTVDCERAAIKFKACEQCRGVELGCEEHAKPQVDDFTLQRMKGLLPIMFQEIDVESALRAQLAAIHAQEHELREKHRIARERMGNVLAAEVMKIVHGVVRAQGGTLQEALTLQDGTVTLRNLRTNEVIATFPQIVPGATAEEVAARMLRVLSAAFMDLGPAISRALGDVMESERPVFLVQADDGKPIDQEHRDIATAWTGGADLAGLNEQLQKCSRPARAFHRSGVVVGYAPDPNCPVHGAP